MEDIGTELATIRGTLENNPDAYYRDEGMQARYRELIEARDSGGQVAPVSNSSKELSELRTMMADGHSEYWRGSNAEANQARYRALISGDMSGGESWRTTPDHARQNLPPEVVAAWSDTGFEQNLRRAQDATYALMASAQHAGAPLFDGFDGLTRGAQTAVYLELARPVPTFANAATEDELDAFSLVSGATECIRAWGADAPRKAAIVLDRYERIVKGMTPADRETFTYWFHKGLTAQERICAFWTIGGR